MTTLVCIGRLDAAALLDAATAVLGAPRDWVALHVVDDGPVAEASHVLGRLPGRDHARHEAEAKMRGMAVHAAAATVAETRVWLEAHGGGEVLLRHGRPEQEILRVAAERRAALIVLGMDPGRRPGPGRLGHTARFVVDHAETGVVLLGVGGGGGRRGGAGGGSHGRAWGPTAPGVAEGPHPPCHPEPQRRFSATHSCRGACPSPPTPARGGRGSPREHRVPHQPPRSGNPGAWGRTWFSPNSFSSPARAGEEAGR